MRKALITALSIMFSLATLATVGEWWERAISASACGIAVVIILILNRRFKPRSPEALYPCRIAAAIAVTVGAVNVITGIGHSLAVASLAANEPEYGPLQILRFTTGAMLVYSGAMNVGVYRAIEAGQRWSIAVAGATASLFVLYLLFLAPLPGTGTARRLVGPWSAYLLWLGAAALASRRATHVGESQAPPNNKPLQPTSGAGASS
jgi:hypothetical protein